ncbi:MAG: pyruvate dehydrogenase (acetyl-transferring), homodimeric type, partial [Candidatus Korobacteraceae bacterium]
MAVHNPAVLEFPASPEIVDEIGSEQNAELAEWVEAFDQVVGEEGRQRGTDLLDALATHARKSGVDVPVKLNTPYVNTIPVEEELPYPGDRALERRIKSLIRWNAMAMVHRQNKEDPGIGGHIS